MKKTVKNYFLIIAIVILSIFCAVSSFADEQVVLKPKGNKNITVTKNDVSIDLEVEVQNAPDDIVFAWYKVDENGTVLDEKSLSDKELFTLKKFPEEFKGQKEYYQCAINYSDGKKANCIFSVTYENEAGNSEKKKPNVVSIEILSKQTKNEYYVGESLDLTGLTLKMITDDGIVPNALIGTDCGRFTANDFISDNNISVRVNPIALKTPGAQEITINIGDAVHKFNVIVKKNKDVSETDEEDIGDILISPEQTEKEKVTSSETEIIANTENENSKNGTSLWILILLIVLGCVIGIGGTLLVVHLVNKKNNEEQLTDYYENSGLNESELVDTDLIEQEMKKNENENDDI